MLRNVASRARSTVRTRTAPVRSISGAAEGASPPPPPPPPKYFTAATIYPFILLSAITSLALNLSHQRTARDTERAHLQAQISVLETILARLRAVPAAARASLSEQQQEDIERELELVGLGRGKGKEAVSAEASVREATSWTEVFFGKKGKGYEEEKDETDWEKVFREADAAEHARQAGLPTAEAAPSPPASPVTPTTFLPQSAPPTTADPVVRPVVPAKPATKAVYL
ncbi:hypothetical protein Rhopal_004821-T1 [Rhodotorula paludigena]|uniref:Altered inheritance of mitochondria protein 5, mitochondrial n=1 Tax=Rhodotorula paludigena TaxID=86838 RepID=A0AAV5GNN3_9BASI|nr:hypothetical protein Rhopal_004821-T1 [Rhodotorula paludigena]